LFESDEQEVNSNSEKSAQIAARAGRVVRGLAEDLFSLYDMRAARLPAEKTTAAEWLGVALFMASFLI
jgi:hypothetical protein